MRDGSVAISRAAFSPTVAAGAAATSPVAARTKLILEGPVLPALLRLSAPNVLNLLATAGMITFDGPHRMSTGRHLPARSRRGRFLRLNRQWVLRIRGTDICRDNQGEGALSPQVR